jgi:hypothetical protein
VDLASFVPDYSGVAVPDSHGVPFGVKPPGHESILFISYHNFYGDVNSISHPQIPI